MFNQLWKLVMTLWNEIINWIMTVFSDFARGTILLNSPPVYMIILKNVDQTLSFLVKLGLQVTSVVWSTLDSYYYWRDLYEIPYYEIATVIGMDAKRVQLSNMSEFRPNDTFDISTNWHWVCVLIVDVMSGNLS